MGESGEKKKRPGRKKTNKWRTMHQHNFDRIFWQWLAIVISFYLMWHWLHYLSAYTEQECITISIAIFNVIYKDYVCIRVAGIVDFSPPHTNRACFWYFFFLSSHRITTLKGSVHLSYIFFCCGSTTAQSMGWTTFETFLFVLIVIDQENGRKRDSFMRS